MNKIQQNQLNMERPILFSTPMVQAILAGRKTQTRRVVKDKQTLACIEVGIPKGIKGIETLCPYGKAGDVLWARETWCLTQPFGPEDYYFGYKAGGLSTNIKASEKYDFSSPDIWKPSIHMPKEACRLKLRITNVRVERLQDISEVDAKAEGLEFELEQPWFKDYIRKDKPFPFANPWYSFRSLWKSINGEQSWNDNPWVWVIEFEII